MKRKRKKKDLEQLEKWNKTRCSDGRTIHPKKKQNDSKLMDIKIPREEEELIYLVF